MVEEYRDPLTALMSHSQPPQGQPSSSDTQQYTRALRNVALVALVACPVLALIPPRKLDAYTIGLVATTGYSVSFLVRLQTGRSIFQHVTGRRTDIAKDGEREGVAFSVPSREMAELSRELQGARTELQNLRPQQVSVVEHVQAAQTSRASWKVQRDREIKEDLDEGKSFSDMIMDQIWEVCNWGKPRDDDDDG